MNWMLCRCPICEYSGLHYIGNPETAATVFASIKVDWPNSEWTLSAIPYPVDADYVGPLDTEPCPMTLPDHLRGDGPCADCGTLDNIVWFTENVLWNAVTRESVVAGEAREAILCIPCFVKRADAEGLRPIGWRLLAEWPWRLTKRGDRWAEQWDAP
jgi:hypothetical protein